MRPKNQLTPDQFLKLVGKKGKSKHKNSIVVDPEYGKFDSKGELSRFRELLILQKSGEITSLERQKEFILIPKSDKFRKVSYIADFIYIENGELVVEDFKNPHLRKKDRVYLIKKTLMYHVHNILIKETS